MHACVFMFTEVRSGPLTCVCVHTRSRSRGRSTHHTARQLNTEFEDLVCVERGLMVVIPISVPRGWDHGGPPGPLSIYMYAGDLNPGPGACIASPLHIKPCPQP